jgi:2-methylcitrate synthase
VKAALEQMPASAHPMDVMRTGVSVLGTVLPEKDDHNRRARDIADRLMASLGSMLLYWYHFSTTASASSGNRRRLDRRPLPAPAARQEAVEAVGRAMHTSLILYAEHEFNASTFTGRVIAGTGSDMYSAITGASARCAARSTAAPTRSRSRSRSATTRRTKPKPTSAAASRTRKW